MKFTGADVGAFASAGSVRRYILSTSRNLTLIRALGFWPWDFPRDSIRHDTPKAFSQIVPLCSVLSAKDEELAVAKR